MGIFKKEKRSKAHNARSRFVVKYNTTIYRVSQQSRAGGLAESISSFPKRDPA